MSLIQTYNFKFLYFKFIYRSFFLLGVFYRKITNHSFFYNKLNELKDIHKGKRVFIICTGPSLTNDDILLLKNEYTISMNSIVKLTDQLNWEPTYYCIQDLEVYRNLNNEIKNLKKAKILVGSIVKKYFPKNNRFIYYPIDFIDHLHSSYIKLKTNFSINSFHRVFDGYTVAYSCLQLAVHMGFNKIYFIGIDANYTGNINENNIVPSGKFDPTYNTAGRRINFAFDKANSIIDKKTAQIFNVTRGGKLESFNRKKIEDIL